VVKQTKWRHYTLGKGPQQKDLVMTLIWVLLVTTKKTLAVVWVAMLVLAVALLVADFRDRRQN
jgi:hypothetical protein